MPGLHDSTAEGFKDPANLDDLLLESSQDEELRKVRPRLAAIDPMELAHLKLLEVDLRHKLRPEKEKNFPTEEAGFLWGSLLVKVALVIRNTKVVRVNLKLTEQGENEVRCVRREAPTDDRGRGTYASRGIQLRNIEQRKKLLELALMVACV